MNDELRKHIHDLNGSIEKINLCYKCIVIDLKESKEPNLDDITDIKESIECFLQQLDKVSCK